MTSESQNTTTTSHPSTVDVNTLDYWVLARHATRSFVSTPVPRHLLLEALELAQHAPSNSNIQPWRLFIAVGAARDRLAASLVHEAQLTEPNIPPLPEAFKHYRSELGKLVYNTGMGIAREDTAGRKAAVLHNYDFFGAPVVAIVCMNKLLGSVDSMGVGMYLQTLMLGLTERGLQSCVEVSVAGYPEILKRELGIGEEMEVLCGLAIGYEDTNFKGNYQRIGRDSVDATTKWLEE